MAGVDDRDVSVRTCARCHGDVPASSAFCPHCGANTAPVAAGPRLAGFSIVRTLGAGGAAVVYLAEQESLQREVAVKVLRHDVEEPKVWRRFLREARTIARLSGHPNVVTIYTVGRSDAGEPYLVTEYLDRGSLGDVVASGGALDPAAAVKVGVGVADALLAAHGLGILHRDVKPGNVLLGGDGRVKLGDFGIARLLAGHSLTTTDVVAFTPEHVAPEILRGEPDGPWSDLYGLASTLAAALIGTSLFARRPDERVEAFLARKLTAPPPHLPPSVPPVLAGIIASGLDPDPLQRPSLGEFRAQLAASGDTVGAVAPPPPPIPAAALVAEPPSPIDVERDVPARPGRPLIGSLRRRRRGLLAIPALLLAIIAATTVALLARGSGDDDGTTGGSNPLVALPTEPSVRSTASPSVASAAPATVAPTAPAPATAPAVNTAAATVAPTTVAPTATPAVAPAPVPTAATTTVAPTTAATSPPPAGDPTVITAVEAATFVNDYYVAVAAGDYETSWAQLTPEFQRGMARSFEYYTSFWDDNDVEIGTIELVEADASRAIVNVDVRENGSSDVVTSQFTLRRDGDGALLIASQETLDG